MNVIKALQPLLGTSPTQPAHSPEKRGSGNWLSFETESPNTDKNVGLHKKRVSEDTRKSDARKMVNVRRLIDHTEKSLSGKSDAKQIQVKQIYIEDAQKILSSISETDDNREDILTVQKKIDELRQKTLQALEEQNSKVETPKEQISMPIPTPQVQSQPIVEPIIQPEPPKEPVTPRLSFSAELASQFETIGKTFSKRPISFHAKRLKSHLDNMRDDLLGAPSPVREVADNYEANDQEIKNEEEEQARIADDIHKIAADFKGRMAATTNLLNEDNKVIEKGAKVIDKNIDNLKKVDTKLGTHRSTLSMNLFTTLNMILMVFVVFFSMVVIIKIFPKR